MKVTQAGKRRAHTRKARAISQCNLLIGFMCDVTGRPRVSIEQLRGAEFERVLAENAAVIARIKKDAA